jgi:hypothetical protein
MSRPLYRPTTRQALCLAVIAAIGLGYGFAMRYAVIENSSIGIACGSGAATWLCASRHTAIALFKPEIFGATALAIALLNLLRPSVVFWTLVLAVGGAGIVLYNTALSALAVAFLVLSLARQVPEAS